jgi:hypothetical protein
MNDNSQLGVLIQRQSYKHFILTWKNFKTDVSFSDFYNFSLPSDLSFGSAVELGQPVGEE